MKESRGGGSEKGRGKQIENWRRWRQGEGEGRMTSREGGGGGREGGRRRGRDEGEQRAEIGVGEVKDRK